MILLPLVHSGLAYNYQNALQLYITNIIVCLYLDVAFKKNWKMFVATVSFYPTVRCAFQMKSCADSDCRGVRGLGKAGFEDILPDPELSSGVFEWFETRSSCLGF